MTLTVREAKAVLACRGGVQVWSREILEALDGVTERQGAERPAVVSHACGYRAATGYGCELARVALRASRAARG